ncbi:MAG TPA: tetratricopeptide repeat protein [Chromatiales bacterium]|nr:tetratricopeptide repeat protein [Thiotrichales bacterium]HIP68287.1 tetratricopeptide repeat protein [Chromatiales bacterium]
MVVQLHAFINWRWLFVSASLIVLSACAGKAPVSPSPEQPVEKSQQPSEPSTGLRQVAVKPEVQQAFNQAVQTLKSGQHKQAIKEFKAVARMNSKLAAPYINMAIAYRRSGDLKNANATVQTALKKDPRSPEALNMQGLLQRQAGELKAAQKNYKKALSIYPNYPEAHLNLAILCDIYLVDWGCAKVHYGQYQKLHGSKDKQVAGWVADLNRRMKKAGKRK